MPSQVEQTVMQWCAAPDISARSVMVTVFGDSIIPVTREAWLSDLVDLCAPFGFSERLVRTCLFRLASEGWVTSERVGRRSRYTLTEEAVSQSAEAAKLIYGNPGANGDGEWTIVLLDTPRRSSTDREVLAKHLKAEGFIELSRDVLAVPGAAAQGASEVAERLGVGPLVSLSAARFDDLERLVDEGVFADALDIGSLEGAYREFLGRYRPLLDTSLGSLSSQQGFALATIMIHEFRRIRLRLVAVPSVLLPTTWVGNDAYAVAAELYGELRGQSSQFVAETLGVAVAEGQGGRFASFE